VASIREGPEAFFRISPVAAGKARCFAVRRGDIRGNANALVLFSEHYGELKALSLCQYPLGTIGDMLSLVQDGLHGVRHYVPEGVPLLGVGNVTDDGIDLSEANYITAEEHARLAASHVKRGDLLVTITGRLGTASIYDSDAPANLSAHVALCRAKPKQELLYLKHYLASRFGGASLTSAQIGSTHPHINVRRLVQLPIPLPPHPKQKTLVAAMDAARAERRAKLAEADALLTGLDSFLLVTLGLSQPPTDNRKVFAATLSEARQQFHLNADYFHPERVLALRAMEAASQRIPYVKLAEVVSFIRDQIKTPGSNYLSLANVQSNTGELVNTDEEAAGACSEFRTGDVLFARLRPYLNKVYRAEMGGCCSPEFHVLRVIHTQELLPDYLAAILRSNLTLAQTRHMMTGNTHPRLTNEDVINLVIPIPNVAVQKTIATEARRRREEARRLRAEAESGWQAAKRWFEEQLLGGPVLP
jgi:type I restriction enzyme S subunit